MTPEQRIERSRKGGLARWAKLTPEQRSASNRAAAQLRRNRRPAATPTDLPPLSPQVQLDRATELVAVTGGATKGAIMLITGAGPLGAAGLLVELADAGVIKLDEYGRWVSTS